MESSDIKAVIGTVLLLAVLASVVALTLHGDLTGGQALAVIGTIVTLGGGALAVKTGISSATDANVQSFHAGSMATTRALGLSSGVSSRPVELYDRETETSLPTRPS